jgi:hypothetical protein
MNPYKHIEDQKQVINDLKYKLQFSKNKVKDAKLINTLIDTVLAFESMLKDKYYTDAIELLICSRMYDHFMRAEVYGGNPIPLEQFNEWLKRDLQMGLSIAKYELKDILKDHELANKLKDRENFNTDFADWDAIITKTINEIKTNIKWTKLT